MSDLMLQRVIMPLDYSLNELYYTASARGTGRSPQPLDRRAIQIPSDTTFSTKSYFNCFFEVYWRQYTRLDRLQLRLVLSGSGTLRLCRTSQESGEVTLAEVPFEGTRAELVVDVPGPRLHSRELGAVHFELRPQGGDVTLHEGSWQAVGVEPRPVKLVAGYCTFNREPFLINNLKVLLEDPDVAPHVARIVVVDQGSRKVKDHPAYNALPPVAREQVLLLEQKNLGGAGGFTRAIVESLDVEGATHVLLMDDDAVTESESVLRTATFLSLAREEIAVSGSMLDLLRPHDLFEATVRLMPHRLTVQTEKGRIDLRDRPAEQKAREGRLRQALSSRRMNSRRRKRIKEDRGPLGALMAVDHTHYGGWWFFAFPIAALERVGLPLPLFIRCDDMEFGVRLGQAGITSVPVPGIGVWHEPFYMKWRGWQPYYEFRNMMVLSTLRMPLSRKGLCRAIIQNLLMRLFSLDYFGAWALCEATEDFLRGPEVLDGDPQLIHQRVLAARRELGHASMPRGAMLPVEHAHPNPPKARWKKALLLLRTFAHQAFRRGPAPDAHPGTALQPEDERWWVTGRRDVVAVDDHYAEGYVVLRRSRPTFLRLFFRGVRAACRVFLTHGQAVERWRGAVGRLTSLEHWRKYLGLSEGPGIVSLPARDERKRASA